MSNAEQIIALFLLPAMIIGLVSCIRLGWEFGGFILSLFVG